MRFFIGLMFGLGIGLVFAPASGEETRRRLAQKADELKQRGVERGREKAGELGREVGERVFDKAVGEER